MPHVPPQVFDAIVHKALASPMRKRLLIALQKKPKYLTELAEEVGKKPQTVDFHLRSLQEIGFVESKWDQGKKFYRLKDAKIITFIKHKRPLPPEMHPKPPHEIVLEAWRDLSQRLDRLEKKVDKILNHG